MTPGVRGGRSRPTLAFLVRAVPVEGDADPVELTVASEIHRGDEGRRERSGKPVRTLRERDRYGEFATHGRTGAGGAERTTIAAVAGSRLPVDPRARPAGVWPADGHVVGAAVADR